MSCHFELKEISPRLKAWAQSRHTWLFIASVAAIAIIAFAYFYPDAAEGNVLRQHDMQQGTAIGQEAKAYAEATGETARWTNSLFGGMPTFQISPSYPSDNLFRWINTLMGLGLPSPANLLAMMMIGFLILGVVLKLRWWVALIGAVAYGLSSYFVIIIGAGHIWKFITLAYIPPTIAGIVYCYRGHYLAGAAMAALFAMMQIAGNHVQMSYYFLPVTIGAALVALIDASRSGKMRRWCIATAALAVAALLAVGANLPSLYNTYEYSKETMRGGHSELSNSVDATASATDGLDRDYITQYSYAPSETFSLLIPNIKGGASAKPEKGATKIMSLSELPDARDLAADPTGQGAMTAQYLQYMSQYFGDPEGTNGPVYVGVLVVALFLLGCIIVRGPSKWMLLVLTVLSIFLAWGRHFMWFTNLAIDLVPMYSKFRTVESILVVAEFTMPLLAMLALQKIATTTDPWKRFKTPFLWCFGIVAGFCLLAAVVPGIYGEPMSDNDRMIDSMIGEQLRSQGYDAETARAFSLENPAIYEAVSSLRLDMVRADGMRSLIIVAAGMALLLLYMRRRLSLAVMAIGVGVIVLGDLFMVNKRYLDHESFVPRRLTAGVPPIAPTEVDRMILADTAMNYRVMDIPRFQSADPSYYHKAVGGYHAAKLTRYQDLIDRHLSHFYTGDVNEADIEVLNMLNARYIVGYDGAPMVNDGAFGNAWMVDEVRYVADPDNEMAALSHLDLRRQAVADNRFRSVLGEGAAATPGDTIFETRYTPGRLRYHATSARGGVAVFSEVYFPWGWHATIDGTPAEIGRVNYLLRAIRIPAGSHTIDMWFDPQSLHTTVNVARASVIIIYIGVVAAIVLGLCCRRKTDESDAPVA